MKITLDPKSAERINAKFSGYEFEVGVLKDSVYRKPRSKKEGLTSVAKGPARRASRIGTRVTVAEVSAFNRANMQADYLRDPFRKPKGPEQKLIKNFLGEFVKMVTKRTNVRRLENLLQAIVRNPIARSDYGSNAISTAKRKGFNRLMIDTAQLFKSIGAKILKSGRR